MHVNGNELQGSHTELGIEHLCRIRERIGLLVEKGAEPCAVEVDRQGKWFILRGKVNSHLTRSHLFDLIPEIDGARWIVDQLRVG
jgi:hypothetical protein